MIASAAPNGDRMRTPGMAMTGGKAGGDTGMVETDEVPTRTLASSDLVRISHWYVCPCMIVLAIHIPAPWPLQRRLVRSPLLSPPSLTTTADFFPPAA